jgi:hypothetical protein
MKRKTNFERYLEDQPQIQLATVSKSRLFNRAGILSEEDMRKVEEAVKIQIGIY